MAHWLPMGHEAIQITDMTFDLRVKVTYTSKLLQSVVPFRMQTSPLMFLSSMYIFDKMIVYGVQITVMIV